MFRFLRSLVYAPKYEKESDMKFFDEISVTIFTILLCMVCLLFSNQKKLKVKTARIW